MERQSYNQINPHENWQMTNLMRKRQSQCLRHIMRDNGLEQIYIITDKIEGKRDEESQRLTYFKSVNMNSSEKADNGGNW